MPIVLHPLTQRQNACMPLMPLLTDNDVRLVWQWINPTKCHEWACCRFWQGLILLLMHPCTPLVWLWALVAHIELRFHGIHFILGVPPLHGWRPPLTPTHPLWGGRPLLTMLPHTPHLLPCPLTCHSMLVRLTLLMPVTREKTIFVNQSSLPECGPPSVNFACSPIRAAAPAQAIEQ